MQLVRTPLPLEQLSVPHVKLVHTLLHWGLSHHVHLVLLARTLQPLEHRLHPSVPLVALAHFLPPCVHRRRPPVSLVALASTLLLHRVYRALCVMLARTLLQQGVRGAHSVTQARFILVLEHRLQLPVPSAVQARTLLPLDLRLHVPHVTLAHTPPCWGELCATTVTQAHFQLLLECRLHPPVSCAVLAHTLLPLGHKLPVPPA